MFKKILLSLGLLGVVSSANATCSFTYYQRDTLLNRVTAGKYIDVNNVAPLTSPKTNVYFDANCNLYLSAPRNPNEYIHDSFTSIQMVPPGLLIDQMTCNYNGGDGGGGCEQVYYYKNTSPGNQATSNPEVDILKAKVQALETKVYQCVQ